MYKNLNSCPVSNKYNNFLVLIFNFSTKTHCLNNGGGLLSHYHRKSSCTHSFRQLCKVDRSSLGRRHCSLGGHITQHLKFWSETASWILYLVFFSSKQGSWGYKIEKPAHQCICTHFYIIHGAFIKQTQLFASKCPEYINSIVQTLTEQRFYINYL